MQRLHLPALALSLCLVVSATADQVDDPFSYFNVYSLGDIGSASRAYGSDFQGVAGAAGNVYFSSFSLHGNDSSTGYVLHAGGSATLTGAYLGSLDIGGNAYLGGLSVKGSVITGGSISNFGGGTIKGDALAGGSVSLTQGMTVKGTTAGGQSYTSMVDHNALSQQLLATSRAVGSMAVTGTVTNAWGNLMLTASSGTNVVNIDAATLKSAWGFTITAPEDAIVLINVLDSDVSLDWTGWSYLGGINADDVLLNMPNATSLELSSANSVNILAPLADTEFSSGLLTGCLIVGDLEGGGQVNLGHFSHGGEIPEPGAAMLLVAGLALLRRRRCEA